PVTVKAAKRQDNGKVIARGFFEFDAGSIRQRQENPRKKSMPKVVPDRQAREACFPSFKQPAKWAGIVRRHVSQGGGGVIGGGFEILSGGGRGVYRLHENAYG